MDSPLVEWEWVLLLCSKLVKKAFTCQFMWGRSVHSRLPRRLHHKAELGQYLIVFLTLETCKFIVIISHPQISVEPKEEAEVRVLVLSFAQKG